jgi:hypothetical protein
MVLQITVVLAVFVLAYIALQILGPRPATIFISLAERQRWADVLKSRIGKLFYVANIAATLTSLATVYVFFIGNSSTFGFAIYVCLLSIIFGATVTVSLTQRLLKTPHFLERFSSSQISTVAITSLFWRESDETSKKVSRFAKLLTITSILSILWLEFATATSIASGPLGIESVHYKSILMFVWVYLVFDFTIRNGLRGFIFLDLLLAPLILLGIAVLAYGVVRTTYANPDFHIGLLAPPPVLNVPQILIFVLATMFLNSFLLITTESHWIRVWTMPTQVRSTTLVSMTITASMWALLILIGLLLILSVQAHGINAVVDLLKLMSDTSPIYVAAFWIAAVAALLSTCDAQLYSLLLVWAFNTKIGRIEKLPIVVSYPSLTAFVVAVLFAFLFYGINAIHFPIDPIVFFLFPVFLCLAPSFVQLIRTERVTLAPILLATCLYSICGIGMLLLPEYEYYFALGSPLMPAAVSAMVWGGVIK